MNHKAAGICGSTASCCIGGSSLPGVCNNFGATFSCGNVRLSTVFTCDMNKCVVGHSVAVVLRGNDTRNHS